jgi:hypothetical protein
MHENVSRERRLLKLVLSPKSDCVSTMRLALPDLQALAHIAGCPRCQAERALLAEFESATPLPEEEGKVTWISQRLEQRLAPVRAAARPEPRWRRWLSFRSLNTIGFSLAAAMVVLALGIGLYGRRQPRLVEPRGGLILRSGEIAAISPVGDLDVAPSMLVWQPVAGASSYSVRVTEVDHTLVWIGETKMPSAALPQRMAAPGKPLFWQVTAKDAGGNVLAQSASQRFRLKQP